MSHRKPAWLIHAPAWLAPGPGPWARAHRPIGPRALALCLYSLDWPVAAAVAAVADGADVAAVATVGANFLKPILLFSLGYNLPASFLSRFS